MAGQAMVTIKNKQWTCWVASTPAELAIGLSGVTSIPVGTGMLFILPQEQVVTVTAEGMLFPLSVIFVGEDLRVTEVALLLAPGDYGTTSLPCRYFLEVNVGEADDISPGDVVSISFSAPPTPPVTDWMAPAVTLAGIVMVGAFLAKTGRMIADAVSGKPKKRPLLYGPRGEILAQPAVIPLQPWRAHPGKDELEFLPDSPEFLAYTIEDIGYRQKIDAAFEQAIARARGR